MKIKQTSRRFQLLEDEEVLIQEPIHWKNYIKPAVVMTMTLFLFLIRITWERYSIINEIAGRQIISDYWVVFISTVEELTFILLFMMMFSKVVTISYTRYYVTNLRIISISGVVNVYYQEMLLSRCEMVYLNQSAYERMYNCGDILCVSAGAQLFLDDVKDAVNFKQTILGILTQRK